MGAPQQILAAGGFTVGAIDFDGTNDYLTRGADLTGLADGKQGTLSVWLRIDGGNGTDRRILTNTSQRFAVVRSSANVFLINGNNSAGAGILTLTTLNTYTAGASWIHLLASWDLAAGAAHLYINDTSDVDSNSTVNDTIDYASGNVAVGAAVAGGNPWHGAMAELWFAGTYMDLSSSSNRRKFIDANGNPVDLGYTGAIPTGTQPALFLRSAIGQAASVFATNKGAGGNFTVNGAPAVASSSPWP
jgi:hypothetical protein